MRITNNMITSNTKININNNKLFVDKYNTQMSTQKKIARASEDPVIAIRALRLATSLGHVNQYADNNIPDAEAWLDVTETALTNMKSILTDIRTQCVNGSNDTLKEEDRNTILQSLKALGDQVYCEGNADYAGRTVFTGYRTSMNLTFNSDEAETSYDIKQSFTYSDIEECRYYSGTVEVPAAVTAATADCGVDVKENAYQRVRLAYDEIDAGSFVSTIEVEDPVNGGTMPLAVKNYATAQDWEADGTGKTAGIKEIPDNGAIFIEATGELIFGKNVSAELVSGRASFEITYSKTGFGKGEVRPEYYYDCTDKTDPVNPVAYTKENQDIKYTIADNTTLTVNTQASDVFDTSIKRDVDEMIIIVQKAINAHDKVKQIESMMKEEQYSSPEAQAKLQTYLDAAKKEADYADDNLQKTYGQYITNFDNYLEKVNLSITNVGSMEARLALTKTRVENQQLVIKELKSDNEDRDISDIVIDYYAAYNAYQSSLTAASKIGSQTLLSYL